jgi:RNA polymerase sigma factor (sigma-70 family)
MMIMADRHTISGQVAHQLMEWAGGAPGGQATDRELMERFVRDRSDGAFADLMARHGAMVLAVCRRYLSDTHMADDAFQATFLVLIRKAGLVRWRESIGGWLFEVATRVARKAAGQAVRRSVREGAPASSAPEPAAPAPVSDLTSLQVALDEELRRLPEKFRTPLVLCHLEGLSQNEVAQQLGVTDGQLRGRLYRAKERLRRRLERRGFSLTAVLLALAIGDQARAIPATLAAGTLHLVTADRHTIPVAVRLLAEGVIRDMTTRFKLLALLALLGALGLGAAGFAAHALTTDPAGQDPAPPPVSAKAAPAPAKPEVADKKGTTLSLATDYLFERVDVDVTGSLGAHRISVNISLDDKGGKGSMEFDPNSSQFNKFGDEGGRTEIKIRTWDVTLSPLEFEDPTKKGRRVYEVKGEGLKERVFLVVAREETGESRLLVADKDGMVQRVLPLRGVAQGN